MGGAPSRETLTSSLVREPIGLESYHKAFTQNSVDVNKNKNSTSSINHAEGKAQCEGAASAFNNSALSSNSSNVQVRGARGGNSRQFSGSNPNNNNNNSSSNSNNNNNNGEIILIPFISYYFPSPDCVLFRQLLEVRREVHNCYYLAPHMQKLPPQDGEHETDTNNDDDNDEHDNEHHYTGGDLRGVHQQHTKLHGGAGSSDEAHDAAAKPVTRARGEADDTHLFPPSPLFSAQPALSMGGTVGLGAESSAEASHAAAVAATVRGAGGDGAHPAAAAASGAAGVSAAADRDNAEALYKYYMSITEQRILETNSDVLALHKSNRVFFPIPCAVAFVYNSSPAGGSGSAALSDGGSGQPYHGHHHHHHHGHTHAHGTPAPSNTVPLPPSCFGHAPAAAGGLGNSTYAGLLRPQGPRAANIHATSTQGSTVRVKIFGFIGDLRFMPVSVPLSQLLNVQHTRDSGEANTPRSDNDGDGEEDAGDGSSSAAASPAPLNQYSDEFSIKLHLYLSKRTGGNRRSQVLLLAAYTYCEQLRRIGVDVHGFLPHRRRRGLSLPAVAGDAAERTASSPLARRQEPLMARSLELYAHSTDVPALCFVREMRARIQRFLSFTLAQEQHQHQHQQSGTPPAGHSPRGMVTDTEAAFPFLTFESTIETMSLLPAGNSSHAASASGRDKSPVAASVGTLSPTISSPSADTLALRVHASAARTDALLVFLANYYYYFYYGGDETFGGSIAPAPRSSSGNSNNNMAGSGGYHDPQAEESVASAAAGSEAGGAPAAAGAAGGSRLGVDRGGTARLRKELSESHKEDSVLAGNLYIGRVPPRALGPRLLPPRLHTSPLAAAASSPHTAGGRDDTEHAVWVPSLVTRLRVPGSAAKRERRGEWVPAGTVLRRRRLTTAERSAMESGSSAGRAAPATHCWVPHPHESAEDILLSLCRDACLVSRQAPCVDGRWVTCVLPHATAAAMATLPTVEWALTSAHAALTTPASPPSLPLLVLAGMGDGVVLWRQRVFNQTVVYATVPTFLKNWQKSVQQQQPAGEAKHNKKKPTKNSRKAANEDAAHPNVLFPPGGAVADPLFSLSELYWRERGMDAATMALSLRAAAAAAASVPHLAESRVSDSISSSGGGVHTHNGANSCTPRTACTGSHTSCVNDGGNSGGGGLGGGGAGPRRLLGVGAGGPPAGSRLSPVASSTSVGSSQPQAYGKSPNSATLETADAAPVSRPLVVGGSAQPATPPVSSVPVVVSSSIPIAVRGGSRANGGGGAGGDNDDDDNNSNNGEDDEYMPPSLQKRLRPVDSAAARAELPADSPAPPPPSAAAAATCIVADDSSAEPPPRVAILSEEDGGQKTSPSRGARPPQRLRRIDSGGSSNGAASSRNSSWRREGSLLLHEYGHAGNAVGVTNNTSGNNGPNNNSGSADISVTVRVKKRPHGSYSYGGGGGGEASCSSSLASSSNLAHPTMSVGSVHGAATYYPPQPHAGGGGRGGVQSPFPQLQSPTRASSTTADGFSGAGAGAGAGQGHRRFHSPYASLMIAGGAAASDGGAGTPLASPTAAAPPPAVMSNPSAVGGSVGNVGGARAILVASPRGGAGGGGSSSRGATPGHSAHFSGGGAGMTSAPSNSNLNASASSLVFNFSPLASPSAGVGSTASGVGPLSGLRSGGRQYTHELSGSVGSCPTGGGANAVGTHAAHFISNSTANFFGPPPQPQPQPPFAGAGEGCGAYYASPTAAAPGAAVHAALSNPSAFSNAATPPPPYYQQSSNNNINNNNNNNNGAYGHAMPHSQQHFQPPPPPLESPAYQTAYLPQQQQQQHQQYQSGGFHRGGNAPRQPFSGNPYVLPPRQ